MTNLATMPGDTNRSSYVYCYLCFRPSQTNTWDYFVFTIFTTLCSAFYCSWTTLLSSLDCYLLEVCNIYAGRWDIGHWRRHLVSICQGNGNGAAWFPRQNEWNLNKAQQMKVYLKLNSPASSLSWRRCRRRSRGRGRASSPPRSPGRRCSNRWRNIPCSAPPASRWLQTERMWWKPERIKQTLKTIQ